LHYNRLLISKYLGCNLRCRNEIGTSTTLHKLRNISEKYWLGNYGGYAA